MILKKLRDLLLSRGLTVYVLPRTDEHQSEYLAEEDERLAHVSGFTGSSGLALVSQDEALVWTDSRYFIQATKQLKEGWKMMKMGKGQPTWFEHIAKSYKAEGTTIGIDARLMTAQVGIDRKFFLQSKGFKINFMDSNLVDEIWERPKKHAEIFVHEEWAAKPASQKIAWIQNKIKEHKGQGCLFTDLSEVGWVLNVRSAQIPYNPFMKSILIIRPEGQNHTLYLPATHPNLNKMSEQLANHLKAIKVELKPYPFLPLPQKLLCQKKSLNYYVYSAMKDPIEWSGIGLFRAVRQQKQRQGFRQSHIRDGVAMAKFWGWRAGKQSVGEYEAAEYMNERRKQQKYNMGLSFQTISAGGGNAAIVHYHPTKDPDFIMTRNMIHLLDSGGQYLDGTTDVTRTFHFGEPSAKEKDAYTRVLLGNLDIQRLKWPKESGVTGSEIDVLARRHLWARNLDYGHGTGHGVGYFQGVHEGPVGISRLNQCAFQPGMIVSNQPGYYEQGSFGIRIQNLILCVQDGDWNKFQCLTLCPYDRNLIDTSLLTPKDIDHINKYHERCWNTLDPLLGDDKVARDWLRAATLPL